MKKAPVRAASRAPRAAAKSTTAKKSVVKRDLPITAIRAALKKAADKLGEDKIPEYDVKKPERASSVPAAAPVSAKHVEDFGKDGDNEDASYRQKGSAHEDARTRPLRSKAAL